MSWGARELLLETPGWLALIPLVAVLWWLASRSGGAGERATGALELWREIAVESPTSLRARWRPSLRATFIAISMLAALIALAQPVASTRESPTRWRVIVDASSGMCVEDDVGRPRGALALERAKDLLSALERPGDSQEWWLVSGAEVLERSDEFPAAWPRPDQARWGLRSPEWERFDSEGVLWVTDSARGLAPRLAGVCSPAREPSDGAIAAWPGQQLAVRGGLVVQETTRSPRLFLAPSLAGGAIARAVAAWAGARGVELVDSDKASAALELRVLATPGASNSPASGSRDGWRLSGPATTWSDARAGERVWLRDEREPARALVRVRRGEIECAFDARARIEGDEASFAIAWAQLLDEHLLPVAALAPLSARVDSEAAVERAPSARRAPGVAPQRWGHVFALIAAASAFAALFARR